MLQRSLDWYLGLKNFFQTCLNTGSKPLDTVIPLECVTNSCAKKFTPLLEFLKHNFRNKWSKFVFFWQMQSYSNICLFFLLIERLDSHFNFCCTWLCFLGNLQPDHYVGWESSHSRDKAHLRYLSGKAIKKQIMLSINELSTSINALHSNVLVYLFLRPHNFIGIASLKHAKLVWFEPNM